jgi:hypothetical protein
MGQGSGIGLCASAWCAMYALQCMLIVYSHPIPMGQGSVMGHWAPSSVLHALKYSIEFCSSVVSEELFSI